MDALSLTSAGVNLKSIGEAGLSSDLQSKQINIMTLSVIGCIIGQMQNLIQTEVHSPQIRNLTVFAIF